MKPLHYRAMMRAAFLLIGILLALMGEAQAQVSGAACQTYFADRLGAAPDEVKAFFGGADAKGSALRRCDFPDAVTPTYELRGPVHKLPGVCVFDALEITERFSSGSQNGGAAAILSDPQFAAAGRDHMFATEGACPAQDDRNYVLTAGLTPGLFKLLRESWTLASSSREQFEAALALRPQPEAARSDGLEFMAMMAEHFGQPLEVQGAYLGMIDPLIASYFLAVSVRDPNDSHVNWIVGFEFVGARLKIAIIQAV